MSIRKIKKGQKKMDTRTVQDVVNQFLYTKSFSYQQYKGSVNQFINIIENHDYENIKKYYPGKDKEFFEAVLRSLGEL